MTSACSNARTVRETSSSLVRQFETEMTDRGAAVPVRPAHPRLAARLHPREHGIRRRVVREAEEHLVEDDLVQDLASGQPRELLREAPRVAAAALDELGDARPAERAERRVHGEAAGAPGELGRPVHRVPGRALAGDEVLGRHRHRGPVRRGILAESQPAVVRHVEPLVRVRRPGVGPLDAGDEVPELGRRRRPEPERAVHVHPGAGTTERVHDLADGIDAARVHLADLRAHDRGAIVTFQGGQRQPPPTFAPGRPPPHARPHLDPVRAAAARGRRSRGACRRRPLGSAAIPRGRGSPRPSPRVRAPRAGPRRGMSRGPSGSR